MTKPTPVEASEFLNTVSVPIPSLRSIDIASSPIRSRPMQEVKWTFPPTPCRTDGLV